jgi:hypothetical protein
MNKKTVAFTIVTILLIVISAAFGYLTAYVKGLENVLEREANIYSHVLMLESLTLSRKVSSSGIKGLIDAVEQNCDSWASFISVMVNDPYRSDGTKLKISEARLAWEKTKNKLEELKSSYSETNK